MCCAQSTLKKPIRNRTYFEPHLAKIMWPWARLMGVNEQNVFIVLLVWKCEQTNVKLLYKKYFFKIFFVSDLLTEQLQDKKMS